LQKQKIGAELHIYLEEGTYHKRLFRGSNTNDMVWSELRGKLKFLRYLEATCEATQKLGFVVYAYSEPALREQAWKKLFPDAETAERVGEFEDCDHYLLLKGWIIGQSWSYKEGVCCSELTV